MGAAIGAAIGAVAGVVGYGIGKGIGKEIGTLRGAGKTGSPSLAGNGDSKIVTIDGKQYLAGTNSAGESFVQLLNDIVVKGSAYAMIATRAAISGATIVSAGLLSIITAIPGDTPARLINDRSRWDKVPPNHPDYHPPKKWDGNTVKNPNRPNETGFPDTDGDVWVPQNHKGTHGKHWDVQSPGGKHKPTYLPK